MEPNTNTPNNEPTSPPTAAPNSANAPVNPVTNDSPQVFTPNAAAPAPQPLQPAIPVFGDMTSSRTDTVVPDGAGPQTVVPGASTPPKGRKFPKVALIGLAAVLLLGVAGAAYYFGYYTKPSVVYAHSLTNTGKGYDKLIEYINEQTKAGYSSGAVGSGTYKVTSGTSTTDGKLSFKGDGENSATTFDIGLGVTRVNVELRTIKSAGDTPDLYLKADGMKGLGGLLGSAEAGTALDQFDNTWIAIDHTLLDNLQKQVTAESAGAITPPTQDDIMDELTAFGKVNQDYVFSTDPAKAVLKVQKTIGKETVNGHSTIHYQVGFTKANVKKYITAQRDALNQSKLGAWIKKNNLDQQVAKSYDELQKSADNIKDSDTIDMWSDVKHRIIYKIRVSDEKNPATNYVDLGLDYKNSSTYPFFLSGHNKDGTTTGGGSLIVTLNTNDNSVSLKASFKQDGPSGSSFDGSFTLKPSSTPVKVEAPANSQPLSKVLDVLGLGDVLASFSGVQTKATDTKRQTDILSLDTQLEAANATNGYYPSLAQLNSASWRQTNMPGLDATALQDPDGTSNVLVAAPAAHSYAYVAKSATGGSCDGVNSTTCTSFSLTATLSDGTAYTKVSFN